MEEYKITVVIPFFNAGSFISECLESVFKQTFCPEEIIVIDDASGKEHADILDQFKERVTLIRLKENSGAGAARTVGIKAAKSEWVAFLDADDMWHPEKLERQVQYLCDHPSYAGCHTGVETFNDSGPLNQYVDKPSPISLDDLVKCSHVTPPSLLLKKEILENLGFFDPAFKTSEDYEFSIRLVDAGYRLGFVSEPLTLVRRSNHGNVSSNGMRTFKNHVRLVLKHRRIFMKHAGLNGIRKFLGKSLSESAGKTKGIKGRLLYFVAKTVG